MLGKEKELGTIEPGKGADLIVLEEDPLVNIRALRDPVYVIRAGELKTPEQWMKD